MSKKFLSLFLAAAMILSLFTIPASANTTIDTAETVKSGQVINGKFGGYGTSNFYKIDLASDGKLAVTDEAFVAGSAWFTLYDSEDREIKPASYEEISGSVSAGSASRGGYFLRWNSGLGKSRIIFNYDLKKGTYYFVMNNGEVTNKNKEFKITPKFTSSSSSSDSDSTSSNSSNAPMFRLTIDEGDRISLGTTFSSGSNIKWSSNKSSVAQVNSNGRVTGRKAGNAVITARNTGTGEQIRIRIRVVD